MSTCSSFCENTGISAIILWGFMLHAVVITNPARHYFLSLLLSLNVDKLIFGLQTALEILFQTNRIFKNNDYRDLSELQIQG